MLWSEMPFSAGSPSIAEAYQLQLLLSSSHVTEQAGQVTWEQLGVLVVTVIRDGEPARVHRALILLQSWGASSFQTRHGKQS